MIKIPDSVKSLAEKLHFSILASFDDDGGVHTSAKGVIEVDTKGKIFVLDVYKARTYDNIKRDGRVTLTIIDEKNFRGYSMKGKARVVREGAVPKNKVKIWHDKLSKRIARRVIRHVKEDSPGREGIPEARFPLPKYIIEISVDEIVDLAPGRR